MQEHEISRFVRQVGFGLAPEEAAPADPLGWASGQLDKVPKVALYTDRAGTLLTGPAADIKLVDNQADVVYALQDTNLANRDLRIAGRGLSPAEFQKLAFEKIGRPYHVRAPWHECLVRGCMAVNGPAPVFERFWHFWANHFTVAPSINNNSYATVGPYMRMLRTHMVGSFRDMLFEAVTHPAMVLYLDNVKSTGPNSQTRKNGGSTDQINENLGRELLELFTISTAAGYTQADVDAVTLILTGWGGQMPAGRRLGALGSFFDFSRHEPGPQIFMGKTYSASPRDDSKLLSLLDDLAAHPLTARHLCHKLATAFIADVPPEECVVRLVNVFKATKGHLPSVHKAVLQEVAKNPQRVRKFSDPQTWLWSIHRVSGTPLATAPPRPGEYGELVHSTLDELGQPIYDCPQPNGWSLQSRDWVSREMMDRRVRYTHQMFDRIKQSGVSLPQLLAKQHAPENAMVGKLLAAKAKGENDNNLWTAYLTAPDFLWSQA
ncbi:MAG: DUF1800 family protein [Rhodoferax sp.]|nr:DUF1800 family protein [Rhodoferax sp.]